MLSNEFNYDSHASLQLVGTVTMCVITVCGLCFHAVVWKVVIRLGTTAIVDLEVAAVKST